MKQYYVYILASERNGTLYTGITNNITRRIYEHKNDLNQGFTRKYKIHRLVYYEIFNDSYNAIAREKAIKKWKREWKLKLINEFNPNWRDMYEELV